MNEKDNSQFIKMTTAPVSRLVISLGIPTTISMLITNIYNMVDTFYIGKLGTSASGAVGIVFTLMAILQAIGFMFGHGAGSIISRLLGQKEEGLAGRYASSSFFTAIICGVVLMILGLIFLDPFMMLLGSTRTILPFARIYGGCILGAAPFMISSFVLNNILRYEGRASFAMIGLSTGGILNICLDPVFMFHFHMGIAGAGLSTALSEIVSFSILFSMFLRGKTKSKISFSHLDGNVSRLPVIIRNGLPSLTRQGFASFSNLLLNHQAAFYGADAGVAAMSIVGRISMLIFSVGLGIGQGYQPVAGYNYGAEKFDRVRKGFWFTTIFAEITLGCLGAAGFFLSRSIISLFRNDPYVIQMGIPALRYQCVALLFLPFYVCSNMLFQSIGKSGRATLIAMLRNGIYFIPLIVLLPHFFAFRGIQMAQMTADMMSFVTVLPITLPFLKNIHEISKKA